MKYTHWGREYERTQRDYEKLYASKEFQWYIAIVNKYIRKLWEWILKGNNPSKLEKKWDWYEIDRRLLAMLRLFKVAPITALQADLQITDANALLKQESQYKLKKMKNEMSEKDTLGSNDDE